MEGITNSKAYGKNKNGYPVVIGAAYDLRVGEVTLTAHSNTSATVMIEYHVPFDGMWSEYADLRNAEEVTASKRFQARIFSTSANGNPFIMNASFKMYYAGSIKQQETKE